MTARAGASPLTRRRILVLYSTLAVGGAERQLALLAPGLRDRGFDLCIATLRHQGRYFDALRASGFETAHVNMRSRTDLLGVLRGYRLWRSRPALVLTQSVNAHVIGQAIARRTRSAHVAIEQSGPGMQHGWQRRALSKLAARGVDRVVAVSRSQIPELRQLGYTAEAIRIIPNGSTEPLVTRPPAEVRRELGLAENDVVVLLVAALRPEKRADVFVDAIALARARDPRVRGLIAGGGPLLEEIQRRATSTRDGLLVLGERSDVPNLMNCADLVALSSDVEGIPLAVVEAMAVGRPVIATDVGGIPEVVAPSTGMLVPPRSPAALSQAILELAAAPGVRAALGAEGRAQFVANFTADLMVERYARLLDEVIFANRRAPSHSERHGRWAPRASGELEEGSPSPSAEA